MSLQYQFVWFLLVSELVAFGLLLIPFPHRWYIQCAVFIIRRMQQIKRLVESPSMAQVWNIFRILLVLVSILFFGIQMMDEVEL